MIHTFRHKNYPWRWIEYDDVLSSYSENPGLVWLKTPLSLDEFTKNIEIRGYVKMKSPSSATPALNTPIVMVPKVIHRWERGNHWYEYNEDTLEDCSSIDPTWVPARMTLAQTRFIMASSGYLEVSPYTPYTKLGATVPATPAPRPSPQSIIKVLYKDDPDFMSSVYGGSTEKSLQDKTCNHQWVCYTGLNESYEFCKLCDLKRGLK